LTTAPGAISRSDRKELRGMSDGSSDRRGRRWLRRASAAAVAGIGLLAAACGGGGSTGTSAGPPTLSSLTAQALAYAKCMRSQGIPNYPDPSVQDNAHNKGVGFSMPSGIDQHSPQFQSAAKLCQQHTGFGHISAAQMQQGMNAALKYAECMRSHEISNYPDPVEKGTNIALNFGGDTNSAKYKAADRACQGLMPGGGP